MATTSVAAGYRSKHGRKGKTYNKALYYKDLILEFILNLFSLFKSTLMRQAGLSVILAQIVNITSINIFFRI